MSSLSDQKMLFVDCQTTGATPATAHLLELGWAVGRAIDPVPPAFVSMLVALPDQQLPPPRIQKITGITAEAMTAARQPASVAADLHALVHSEGIVYAVAHWAQFERTFLSDFFVRHPSTLDPFGAGNLHYICTCQIAKKLYPELPSRAIRAVGGYFGLDVEEMKRSAGHVESTYFIWQKLALDLEKRGIGEIEELIEWLKPAPKIAGKKSSRSASPAKKADEHGRIKNGVGEKFLLPLERLRRLDLPSEPGVYRMLNSHGKILYVGKATSLKSRVNSYFTGRKGKASKTKELISQVFDLHVSPLATPLEAALLENDLIKEHDPPYNRALKKRDRSLIYFSADFASLAERPDGEHCCGPFPRGSTIEPLILLVEGLRTGRLDPGLFWGLLDQEATDRAVALFFAEQNVDAKALSEITVRNILALGLSLYRRSMLDGLALAGTGSLSLTYFLGPPPSGSDDGENSEDCVDGRAIDGLVEGIVDAGDEANSETLTDEELCGLVRGLVVSSARAYAVTKTLVRLLDTTIKYEEKKRRRQLVFQEGRLIYSADIPPSARVEEESAVFRPGRRNPLHQPVELATYDRMRVLLGEVRRLHNRGHWLSFLEGQGHGCGYGAEK
ncbi:MAG: GIY-YIG nuclease family protein [Cyanobacteria bacterium REEB67]|nr:GIY-YIG nuclease family protein [Cyanobacteria bacterium REEB67]